MVTPASKNLICRRLLLPSLGAAIFSFLAFKAVSDLNQLASAVSGKLTTLYNHGAENGKLRKFEFQITPEGFFRYRKIYAAGKSEYYSFSVSRLREVNYLGTTATGKLVLKTSGDDIIVQTYNDPRGNVDSMTTDLAIPVREVQAEDLQLISTNLQLIAEQLQVGVTTPRLPGR